jgi:hypothetical protein
MPMSVPGPASLGPEVFRCRLVSGASAEKRAGFSLTALDHLLRMVAALVQL